MKPTLEEIKLMAYRKKEEKEDKSLTYLCIVAVLMALALCIQF